MSTSTDPGRQLTARCLAGRAASPSRVAAEITHARLRDLRHAYGDTAMEWSLPEASLALGQLMEIRVL
jgi:hypothetical protein